MLALVLLCACEPKQPDHEGWRDAAYYAVTGVTSDVSTALLVLRELRADHIAGNWAQVAMVTAEKDAGKQAQKLTGEQPPRADSDRFSHVSDVLSSSGDLLTSTRIAVVRRDSSEYSSLMHRLSQQKKSLEEQTSALGGLRG